VQNLTAQKVVMALVTLAFFIAAPYLISEVLNGNTAPLAALLGLGALLLFVFGLGEKCWLSIPLCLPMGGSLNILPVKFSPHELSILLVIAYVLFQFIMTDRRRLSFGPPYIWAPLLLIAAILIYHETKGGKIGLNMFGGQGAGGRKTFTILCGMLALPAILWFKSPGEKWLRAIPLLYLFGSLIDFAPFLATSFIPSVAPLVYRIYSSVNLDAFSSTLVGANSELVRVGAIGQACLAIQLVLLCYFQPKDWIRPSRFFVPVLSFLVLVATIWGGFRSALFNYLMVSFCSLFFIVRWTALLTIPAIAVLITVLVLGQGSAFNLPLTMQRTLSPFPGKWSRIATDSAESSNDFRDSIKKTYCEEFMKESGMFGSGYKYSAAIMRDTALSFYNRNVMADSSGEARGYITQRDHHVGWVAVHHPIGTIGLILFIFLCLASLYFVLSNILKVDTSLVSPQQCWSSALIIQIIFSYFAVFGAMQHFIPQLCILLAIAIISFRPTKPQIPNTKPQRSTPSAAYQSHSPSIN
jgi:hypothetical protein